MMRQRLIILSIIGISILVLFLGITSLANNAKRTAAINTEVVPAGANIRFNGKKGGQGLRKIEPGTYEVTIAKEGFITEKRKVTVKAGVESYVGVALVANTAATNNWYQSHPADAKKAETISSHNFDEASSALANNPLVKKLPYIGAGFEFRIDYGAPRNLDNPGQPIIYIQAKTPEARQDSLRWIRSFGYDPATMDIIFKDATNPFEKVRP